MGKRRDECLRGVRGNERRRDSARNVSSAVVRVLPALATPTAVSGEPPQVPFPAGGIVTERRRRFTMSLRAR
jgi:hypothetical protein